MSGADSAGALIRLDSVRKYFPQGSGWSWSRPRRQVRRALHGQGMGRHAPEEIVALGTRSIDAAADFLGTKPFLMGSEPTGVDATAFAFVAGLLCPVFETKLRTAAERRDNLRRYVGRMTVRFYPDRSELAGCQAAA